MKTVYAPSCLFIGLILLMNACGDPPSFHETLIRQSEALEPEAATSPGTPSTAYEGDEQDTPPPTTKPDVVSEDPGPSEDPGQSGTDDPTQSVPAPPVARLFDDCEDSPGKNIVGRLYELPVDTERLPDFSSLSPLRTVCVGQLNITDRQFTEGFPGVEGLVEWFALDMDFYVTVPRTGTYEFSLAADDGAMLWINGSRIIDNDGLHEVATRSAQVHLEAGVHAFRVAYFQGPRWRIALELFWKIPGSAQRTYIPAVLISRME